jgi:cardiolipin synthase A/B
MLPLQPLKGHWRRPDLRNHRKLVVIDGRVGHTGSLNMIVDNYHKKANVQKGLHWHELMARFRGPVVRALDAVFVTDWYSETKDLLPLDYSPVVLGEEPGRLDAQVVPSGPSFENDNNLKLFAAVIQNARERISITSPYYVPDETIQMALVTAGSRGLDVELFVSEIGDQFMVFHAQHSYYRALLEAGVRIYLYPGPSILHAKHMSVDDLVTVVGSSNMDIRSFDLDLEVTLMTCGRDLAEQMRAVEDEYRAVSRELTLKEWSRQSFRHGVVDGLARLTSAVQ